MKRRANEEEVQDLARELKEIVDKNMSDDGDLDEYDTPEFFNQAEDEDDQEEDYTDLDADLGEDDEAYDKMEVSKPTWPQHDWSCITQPAAINRYMVDYLRLVARIRRVSRVLSR